MRACVVLNLLNKLGKRDQMRTVEDFIAFSHKLAFDLFSPDLFNKFNNAGE